MVSADPSFLKQSIAFRASKQLLDSLLGIEKLGSTSKTKIRISKDDHPSLFHALAEQRYAISKDGIEIVMEEIKKENSHRMVRSDRRDKAQDQNYISEISFKDTRKLHGAPRLETEKRAVHKRDGAHIEKHTHPRRLLTRDEASAMLKRLTLVREDNMHPPITVNMSKKNLRRSLKEQSEYSEALSKRRSVIERPSEITSRNRGVLRVIIQDRKKQWESIIRLSQPRTLEQMFSRYLKQSYSEVTLKEKEDFGVLHDLPLALPKPELSAYALPLELRSHTAPSAAVEPNPHIEQAFSEVCDSILSLCESHPEKCSLVEENVRLNILPSLSRRPMRERSKKYESYLCGSVAEALTLVNMFQQSELCLIRLFSLLCMLKD